MYENTHWGPRELDAIQEVSWTTLNEIYSFKFENLNFKDNLRLNTTHVKEQPS